MYTTEDILKNLEDVSQLAIESHFYALDHDLRQDPHNKIGHKVINQVLDKEIQHNDFEMNIFARYGVENNDQYRDLVQKAVFGNDYRLYEIKPELSYMIEKYGRQIGIKDAGIKEHFVDHSHNYPGEIIHMRHMPDYNGIDHQANIYLENELNYHLFNGIVDRDDLENPKALINFLRFCNESK